LTPLAEERPSLCDISSIYTSLKSTFTGLVGYNSVPGILLAANASQICEITRNSEKIRTYSSSKSSNVYIDLGAKRKRIFNV